jgi:hypothetical protein
MYQPRIYPATVVRLAPIARKHGMSIEKLANTYLNPMIAWDELTAKELCAGMLEDILIN